MRKILGAVAIISFIVMTGFVGGLDRDLLSPTQGFVGALISVLIFGICVYLLKVSEPIHSGNLDFCGPYSENKKEVKRLVDELNERGEK